jgi:hypothetical protein
LLAEQLDERLGLINDVRYTWTFIRTSMAAIQSDIVSVCETINSGVTLDLVRVNTLIYCNLA